MRDNSHAVSLQWMMDHFIGVQPGETYWANSNVGWGVCHSLWYGALLHGCTTVLFEDDFSVATHGAAEFWRVIERHAVNAMVRLGRPLHAVTQIPRTRRR